MTERTFGIEIEGYGLDLRTVAQAITRVGIPCRVEGYGHSTPTTWKVVTDVSISGSMGFEVVSPILRGEDGFNQVRAVCDALTAAGAKVNKSCGLHVHIGAADFRLQEIRQMAKNYIIFENFFDAIVPPSRRKTNNIYIKSNRDVFGGYGKDAVRAAVAAIDAAANLDDLIHTVCPSNYGRYDQDNGRYRKLNLCAFWRHRTIEFRQHSGTTDAEKAVNWIKLVMQFVNRAGVTRQRVVDRESTQAQTFAAFFRTFRIDAELKPFFAARRKHFHPEEGEGPRVSNTMRRGL